MNTENSFASRNDEVVFDNRNKSYGAYSIRRSYTSSLTKGSGGSLLVAGFFVAAVQVMLMMKPDSLKPITGCVLPPLKLTNDIQIIPDQPIPPPTQEVKQSQGFPTRVVTHEVVMPPPEETNVPASPGEVGQGDPVPVDGTGPSLNLSTAPTVVEPPKIVDFAEVMPEFEGGAKAMYKFLQRHLRYPRADQRIGIQGTVFVRFIIDITGTVTGVEVVRGVSGTLDKEAMRVIALMPKWKPGSQHGTPVNIRMVLPIKFEMDKE